MPSASKNLCIGATDPSGWDWPSVFFPHGLSDERAKMERVPQVLQFSVIVKRHRVLSVEPNPLEKVDFLSCRTTGHGQGLQEFIEPWLFLRVGRCPFDTLNFRCVTLTDSR